MKSTFLLTSNLKAVFFRKVIMGINNLNYLYKKNIFQTNIISGLKWIKMSRNRFNNH